MLGNSFGKSLTLTTFGESHGKAMGGIIDGFPSNIIIDIISIQKELDRRKPGTSELTTSRKEEDVVEFLSWIFESKSLGTPISFIIKNKDVNSKDYDHLKDVFRPSHADFTYQKKYNIRDHRGGGRSSARETACRVVAGSLAKQLLKKENVKIMSYVSSVGNLELKKDYKDLDLEKTDYNVIGCPDEALAKKMEKEINKVKHDGDTVGGIVTCIIQGCRTGWGEPVFDKLHADLAKAMLSINAVKGFELGGGFLMTTKKGSQVNDVFLNQDGKTETNFSGGIQGGISNGNDIYFNVGFKPVSTLMQNQVSVDKKGQKIKIKSKGRHDPCVLPRARPIVEAMAALVIADHYLRSKTNTIWKK